MKDNQLGARVPQELVDKIKKIADGINEKFPEANATTSTIVRYALQEYIKHREEEEKAQKDVVKNSGVI